MIKIRTSAKICAALLLVPLVLEAATPAEKVHSIDCAGDPRALIEAQPVVQHQDGHELHQYWILADREDLWGTDVPVHEALARYRQQVRAIVADTGPLALIRANRERFPWLEREHPAEGRINRAVESGVGTHRPMNCLETHLLAYQATRFPLYEQPSEIVAVTVRRSSPAGDQVKVYISADDDAVPPMPNHALESIESDLAAGWRVDSIFHNHTFNHSEDRGHLPVAAPSANDVQVSVAVSERLDVRLTLVSDGFSTLEITQEELQVLAKAAMDPAPE